MWKVLVKINKTRGDETLMRITFFKKKLFVDYFSYNIANTQSGIIEHSFVVFTELESHCT